jgi:hypothetical protein
MLLTQNVSLEASHTFFGQYMASYNPSMHSHSHSQSHIIPPSIMGGRSNEPKTAPPKMGEGEQSEVVGLGRGVIVNSV